MYSRLQLARKYIRYYLTASNGKGHGVHSPFVYEFIRNVLRDRRSYPAYALVEGLRARLLQDERVLEVEDLGAGSGISKSRQRAVRDIARHAAKPAKLGRLLYRIARYYRCRCVVELGTSLGLSTGYLAGGAGGDAGVVGRVRQRDHRPMVDDLGGARIWTIEGAPAVAAVAADDLRQLGLDHVQLVVGNFDERLEEVLASAGEVDLVFVDGNHRKEPTLRYFHLLMKRCAPGAIFIFDDIHWSREMEEAWAAICADPRVFMTIDLFFIGVVVFREEFKVPQHFVIRF